MMGWLIALTVLVGLAVLPLGVGVIYHHEGAKVWVILGPVRITLFPRKKKAEKKSKPKREKPPKPKKTTTAKKPKEEKKGGSFLDFLPLVRTALEFLGAFRRKLRVNRLEMKLTMAGGNPCDLAINYGKAWAALGNLMPHLDKVFVIKKKDLGVFCDFAGDKTLIYARLDLTITLGRLLAIAVYYGIKVVKQFISIQNKRKGGVKNESKITEHA